MKTFTHIALFACALAATLPAQAQEQRKDSTLNRTVVIENQYNPQLMDADKINLLPAIEEPEAPKKQIEYATEQRRFNAFRHEAMPVFGPRPEQADAPRSYLNLGYGNNGNLTGEFNYLFTPSPADRLNVHAAFDGKNFETDRDGDWGGWQSRFYQSDFRADYSHRFEDCTLGARASFGTQTFNYLPTVWSESTPLTDKQNNLLGGADVFVRSTRTGQAWQYHAEAGIHYFGRDYYSGLEGSNSETNLRLDGGLSYGWDARNRAGLDLRVNYAAFALDDTFTDMGMELENTGVIGLNPYYAFANESMRLRAGARIDINTGVESGVNLAPDIRVECPLNRQYTLYAQATGGTLLNDYFRFNTLSPYWTNYLPGMQLENTHVQFDAMAGFRAALLDNLWLDFFIGYELRKNEASHTMVPSGNETAPLPMLAQGKANNLKFGLATSYRYKDLLELAFDGTYRSWSTDDHTEFLLFDKPQLDLRFDLGVHPLPRLTVNLGYRHRTYAKGDMEAVSDLYAGADYRCFDLLSVWVKASNLMNREYSYYFGYPEESIHFLVGASFRF